jgi:hypothetical protein
MVVTCKLTPPSRSSKAAFSALPAAPEPWSSAAATPSRGPEPLDMSDDPEFDRLMASALAGDDTAVSIAIGARPPLCKGYNGAWWTPLHKATTGGHLPVIRRLLECNADVDAQNDKGTTPLIVSAKPHTRQVPCHAVRASSAVLWSVWSVDLSRRQLAAYTSQEDQYIECIKVLLAAGADKTLKDDFDMTAFDCEWPGGDLTPVAVGRAAPLADERTRVFERRRRERRRPRGGDGAAQVMLTEVSIPRGA